MRTLPKCTIGTLLMTAVFLICLIFYMLFAGCATTPPCCPDLDVADLILTPYGPIVVITDKDHYCKDQHSLEKFLTGHGWITLEEYEAWKAELEKEGSI